MISRVIIKTAICYITFNIFVEVNGTTRNCLVISKTTICHSAVEINANCTTTTLIAGCFVVSKNTFYYSTIVIKVNCTTANIISGNLVVCKITTCYSAVPGEVKCTTIFTFVISESTICYITLQIEANCPSVRSRCVVCEITIFNAA